MPSPWVEGALSLKAFGLKVPGQVILSVHFPETIFICFKALLGLTVADICLIYDRLITFFVLLTIAIALELFCRKLHEVVLRNHEIDVLTKKTAESEAHALAMKGVGTHH
jgi:hypothetical protein